MSVTAPVPPPDFVASPPRKKAKRAEGAIGVSHAGWFTRITLVVVVLIWLVPTAGVLVTSFRPVHLVETSGWWTALGHPFRASEWTTLSVPRNKSAEFNARVNAGEASQR